MATVINPGRSRFRQFAKNIFSSWALQASRALMALIFIPVISASLGEARFGVWVILFAALDYLALADFGLKQALVRYVAQVSPESKSGKIGSYVSSAIFIYLALAALVIAMALALIANLEYVVAIPDPALLAEAKSALFIVALQLALVFLFMPFAGALEGLQRFDLANMQSMVSEALRFGLLLYLLSTGAGLIALAWVVFGVSLLRQLWIVISVRRICPEIRLIPKRPDKESARQLIGYSKVAFLITFLWLIISRSDSFILGSALGVAAAGIYAPAGQLMHYLRLLVNAIGAPLVPLISQLTGAAGGPNHNKSDDSKSKLAEVYLKGLTYVSFVTALFGAGCLFYAAEFVGLWLPPEFSPAAEALMILAVAGAIVLPQIIGESILFGIGEHRRLVFLLIFEAALKIPLSIFLVGQMGLIGLAWGSAIPQVILYSALYPLLMKRAIGVSPLRSLIRMFRSMLLAALPVALVSLALGPFVSPGAWPGFALHIALILALALALAPLILDSEDRKRMKTALKIGAGDL